MILVPTLFITALLAAVTSANYQTIQAGGKIQCKSTPGALSSAKIQIINKPIVGSNTVLANKVGTNSDGSFNLQGYKNSHVGKIRPHLIIEHKCGSRCEKKWDYEIPQKFIDAGGFDLGTVNLEAPSCKRAGGAKQCSKEKQTCPV